MSDAAERAINARQFDALIKAADQAKTKVASVNGEIGERIKHAVDNANLHPGAFKAILKLVRMDDEKRDAWLRNFDLYRDMAGELNLFEEHVGDLADMADRKAATEAEDDERAAAKNTELLEKGITPIPNEEFDDETSTKPSRRRPRLVKSEDAETGDDAAGTYMLN